MFKRAIVVIVVMAVAAFGLSSPAVAAPGSTYAWGDNQEGTVGIGNKSMGVSAPTVPTLPAGVTAFTSIVSSEYSVCGIGSDTQTYCWGYGGYGELGNGLSSDQTVPTPVTMPSGVDSFASIYAGKTHMCALDTDGDAYCWGKNEYGRTGVGTTSSYTMVPTAVLGGLKFSTLNPANYNTCGLTTGAKAYCWGYGGWNGNGNGNETSSPSAVVGNRSFTMMVNAPETFCAQQGSGELYCWGNGGGGQNGDGTFNDTAESPVLVTGGLTFTHVTAGNGGFCATVSDGTGYCWGFGSDGQIGNGASNNVSTPTAIQTSSKFASLAASGWPTVCGLTTDGDAYCWGSDYGGALGKGTNNQHANTPQLVLGGHKYVSLTRSQFATCGLTTTYVPYCWGRGGNGQIGNGSTANALSPAAVTLPAGVPGFSKIEPAFYSSTVFAYEQASATVTFNANGGVGSMADQTSTVAANLTANAYTRVGYTFASWNTQSDNLGTSYANQEQFPFATNATLYAQWTAVAPVISGVSPASGPAAGGTVLTITGTDFTQGTTVQVGGVACAIGTVNSEGTSLTCTTGAKTPGLVDVVVTTDGGSDIETGAFTYLAAPSVTTVSPTSGPSSGGTVLTISGSDFTAETTVEVGGVECIVESINVEGTTLTCTTGAHAAGLVDVQITTIGGSSTKSGAFTYQNATKVCPLKVVGARPSVARLPIGRPVVLVKRMETVAACKLTVSSPRSRGDMKPKVVVRVNKKSGRVVVVALARNARARVAAVAVPKRAPYVAASQDFKRNWRS